MSNTPGVEIKEITSLAASVAGVSTAVPAFIGHTELAPASVLNVPTKINSFSEYVETYGGPQKDELKVTLTENANGISSVKTEIDKEAMHRMYYALKLYFSNGGGPCYILTVGDYNTNWDGAAYVEAPGTKFDAVVTDAGDKNQKTKFEDAIDVLEQYDEPTLIVMPDAANGFGTASNYYSLVDRGLKQASKLQDRFVIADTHAETAATVEAAAFDASSLKYGAIYHPYLETTFEVSYDDSSVSMVHNGAAQTYDTKKLSDVLTGFATPTVTAANQALYAQLKAQISAEIRVTIPSSGAIAGVYCKVDRERGVWKAPANVSLSDVIAPSDLITAEAQSGLNIIASGRSVNVIRSFAGKGSVVWGARTLAGNDNEWKYVPVRRLYNYVEESVKNATEFVVFEPNTANTWVRTKTMVENFLTQLWRDGGLAGATPQDAYFVRIGLGETMTSQDILEGRMNIEIGMAAVRPAEFIVLKFSHKLQA
ncbi:MAG: phage tail sheath family protein [Flavobacteriales bacterium]|nr:phage tail sheath family protein [Flavobacteriales bacterium]